MATKAGTVSLQLDADSVKLLRELKKSQQQTRKAAQSMQQSMTRSFKAIEARTLKLSGVLAGAFGARAMAGFIKGQVEFADKILKTTQRIGGTTEAFSELAHVADLSGVSFDKLTQGMQRMTRRIAEAAMDSGEAVAALKELGLSASRLKALQIDEQFEEVADALSAITNESDKTRLAMKLFDSEGVALLQTMTNGAAGIREMRDEARELGLTLSEENAVAAAEANNEMTKFRAVVSGLGQDLAISLIPGLTAGTEALRAFVVGLDEAFRGRQVFEYEQEIRDLEMHLESLQTKATLLSDVGRFEGAGLEPVLLEILDVSNRIDELKAKQRQSLGFETPFTTLDEFGPEFFEDINAQTEAIRETWRKFMTDVETASEELEPIEIVSLDRSRESIEHFEALQEQAEAAHTAAMDLRQGFVDAFGTAIAHADDLRDAVKILAIELVRLFAFRSTASSGTDMSGLVSGIGSAFAARASGGPVTSGTPYLVGEKGRELFVPESNGVVLPNHALGGSSARVNYVINIDSRSDRAQIQSELIPLLEKTVQTTRAIIRQDKTEGRL